MAGPGFSQDLRQRQTQSLVLAPQLRQSLKILQVAALDLRSVIQEELQNNPTLEELPMEGTSLEQQSEERERDNLNRDGEGPNETPSQSNEREQMDFSKEFDILTKLDEDWRDYMSNAGGAQPFTADDAEKRQHFFDSLVTETSLQEHLMRQAEMTDLGKPAMVAMQHLVGSLDDRGFLTQTASDVALQTGLPLDVVQEALKTLKAFEPAGIGAKDLGECLVLQLQAKGRGDSLAARIVRDHFTLLTRRRIPELARKIGAHMDDVQEAIEEIGKLDPAPGRRFADDNNRVVVPDVTVEDDRDEWKIILNSDYIPRLRISSTYRDMIAKGSLSKDERDYLRERMRSGKFLIDSIEQRQRRSSASPARSSRPGRVLREGVAKLKPLTMTQIADVVGVHETTVSRAIANKFIKTPHGVFEFKYFFTPDIRPTAGPPSPTPA
jgi:RNA polymerase sigma-54 factor